MKQGITAEGGFSLVEILVALAITAVAVLGASTATLTTIRVNRLNQNVTVATTLAMDRLERIRSDYQAGVSLTSGNDPSGCTFCRAWTIPDPDVAAPAGLSSVRITVSWRDYRPESVTLHTLIDG